MKKCSTNAKKRRALTLVEMVVVMVLIAMITSAVAYNYRGSLEKGKAFKTKELATKIETILELVIAQDPEIKGKSASEYEAILKKSPLLSKNDGELKDGWGQKFVIEVTEEGGETVVKAKSQGYTSYISKYGPV